MKFLMTNYYAMPEPVNGYQPADWEPPGCEFNPVQTPIDQLFSKILAMEAESHWCASITKRLSQSKHLYFPSSVRDATDHSIPEARVPDQSTQEGHATHTQKQAH